MKALAWQVGIVLASFAVTLPLAGQESGVRMAGQVRPRLEGRTPVQGSWDTFTSMRVRGAMDARLERGVRVFVQVQDVRIFGEESNTLGDFSADNLDLHQGYLELASVPGVGGTLRVGRQEMALGEQRLVGAVDWAQQGRSFDGLRYILAPTGPVTLDLFGMKLRDETAGTQEFDSEFVGVWSALALGGAGSLDVFGLFLRESRELGTDLRTFGGLWRADVGRVKVRIEGSLQGGTRGESDVSAYMFGVAASGGISGGGTVGLSYDHLSGDDDPDGGESRVFSTLFATNHIFYGLADYFTDIPAHTGGLGLRDLALKYGFDPWAGTRFSADLHHFRAAKRGSLSTTTLGNELDLTFSRRISQELGLVAGYSFFQARTGMEELGRLNEDGHWAYLMLNAVF